MTVDFKILGVHQVKSYDDDSGYGLTWCGLPVFPFDAESGKPARCEECDNRSSESTGGRQ